MVLLLLARKAKIRPPLVLNPINSLKLNFPSMVYHSILRIFNIRGCFFDIREGIGRDETRNGLA